MNVTIRDWTFTHFWVRPVVKVWFDLYHKSVTYSGEHNVDWGKPIIFAPSHQSAFTDALCLILPAKYTNDRFIYPLVRADAFGNSKVMDWILTSFHMMPVYRPKDKVDIKERNKRVFADCYNILSQNRNLLIHPEGNCFSVKKVRRFKKGLARIAFGAEMINEFDLDTIIIPVGINYRNLTGARGGIHIRYGEPVSLQDYEEAYREHAASAIAELTREVEERVREVTVDIQTDEHYALIEDVMGLAKKMEPEFAMNSDYSLEELSFEKIIISNAEAEIEQGEEGAHSLERIRDTIRALLREQKLDPNYSLSETYSYFKLIAAGIGFLILLPVFIYGWINNILPWYLIHKLASGIEDRQFINSARMASGLLLFPVFFLVQSLVIWLTTGSLFWTLGYLISLPVTGIIALKLFEKWKEWKQQVRLRLLSDEAKNKLSSLKGDLLNKIGPRR